MAAAARLDEIPSMLMYLRAYESRRANNGTPLYHEQVFGTSRFNPAELSSRLAGLRRFLAEY